jgi:hypothetical protein
MTLLLCWGFEEPKAGNGAPHFWSPIDPAVLHNPLTDGNLRSSSPLSMLLLSRWLTREIYTPTPNPPRPIEQQLCRTLSRTTLTSAQSLSDFRTQAGEMPSTGNEHFDKIVRHHCFQSIEGRRTNRWFKCNWLIPPRHREAVP